MASGTYNRGRKDIISGTINLTSDTLRAMLVKSSYTFDPDVDFVSDISSSEVGVSGYSRADVTTKAFTELDATDRVKFSSDGFTFSSLAAGETVGGIVFYRQVGGSDATPANDELIYFGDITINPHTDGWFYVT